MILLYLRADFLLRVKQHSELWCNRRMSERRAELARAIPSEEEEGEVKTYKERCRRESKRPQLLLLGKMQYE